MQLTELGFPYLVDLCTRFHNSNGVVGFTGTRKGMTESQRLAFTYLLSQLLPKSMVHGDCIGADKQADREAFHQRVPTFSRPGNMPTARAEGTFATAVDLPRVPTERNRSIVRDADLMIACPDGDEVTRSGTWATVRFAMKTDTPVLVLLPSGSCELRVLGRIHKCDFSRLITKLRATPLEGSRGFDGPIPELEIRPAVSRLAADMEEKLRQYDDRKDGWSNLSTDFLVARLEEELLELKAALEIGNNPEVILEAADIANFAMMIADNARNS